MLDLGQNKNFKYLEIDFGLISIDSFAGCFCRKFYSIDGFNSKNLRFFHTCFSTCHFINAKKFSLKRKTFKRFFFLIFFHLFLVFQLFSEFVV